MVLTNKSFSTRFPCSNSDYIDTLSNDEYELYLILLEGYYRYLYEYVNKRINVVGFDNMLSQSKNNYTVVDDKDKDIYQLLSNCNYLYIRNNVYIERLKPDDLNYLKSLVEGNIEYNEEIDTFIDRTYKELINEYENQDIKTNFGPEENLKYFANSSNLIIGYRVGNDVLSNDQYDELSFASSFFRVKSENTVSVPVTYIMYDSESVRIANNQVDNKLQ